MVVRNKVYRIFDKYRTLLNKRREEWNGTGSLLRGNRTKNRILDFYLKNNRWPNRRLGNKFEKVLAQRFENFVSKENGSYDATFRRIVMAMGRKTNNKRKHDKRGFKKQILDFIDQYGRTPMRYAYESIEGEGNLRAKLDYYTLKQNDMTFLSKVYKKDKCHKTGIPGKYRSVINQSLDIDTPLVRLV
jgi:hypothetical protein